MSDITARPGPRTFRSVFAGGVARLARPVRRKAIRPDIARSSLRWGAFLAGLYLMVVLVDAPLSQGLRALPAPIVQIAAAMTDIGLAGVTLWPTGVLLLAGCIALARPWRYMDYLLAALLLRCVFVFIAVAGSGLIVTVVKRIFGRARPWTDLPGAANFEFLSLKSQFVSFPSGHATAISAGCLALALLFPRARWPLLALAILICLTRIVVGAHFPSDVMAGAAFGAAFTYGTFRWFGERALVFPAGGGHAPMLSTAYLLNRLVSAARTRRQDRP